MQYRSMFIEEFNPSYMKRSLLQLLEAGQQKIHNNVNRKSNGIEIVVSERISALANVQ